MRDSWNEVGVFEGSKRDSQSTFDVLPIEVIKWVLKAIPSQNILGQRIDCNEFKMQLLPFLCHVCSGRLSLWNGPRETNRTYHTSNSLIRLFATTMSRSIATLW